MKTNWKELIEQKREEIEKAIFEQWKEALTEPQISSMRHVVLLWDDGEVTTGYRDQNSWSTGEHNGTAICMVSFKSQRDDCISDFDSEQDYIDFMCSEYPVDASTMIDDFIQLELKYQD